MVIVDEFKNIGGSWGFGRFVFEAQTFTPQINFKFNRVDIYLKKPLDKNGETLYIDLKAVDGEDKPTGNSLSSTSIVGTDISPNFSYVIIKMPEYNVVKDTKYAIVLSAPGSDSLSYVTTTRLTGEEYPRGEQWESEDSGSTWATNGSLPFKVHEEFIGGSGTKAIATRYPVEEGLTAGTTTQEGRTMNLEPDETIVTQREQVGL